MPQQLKNEALKIAELIEIYRSGKTVIPEFQRDDVWKPELRHRPDNLANIAFISGEANRSLGLTGPKVYLKKIAPKILKSQCIPIEESLWKIDTAQEFWDHPRELLALAFNDFLKTSFPDRRLSLSQNN